MYARVRRLSWMLTCSLLLLIGDQSIAARYELYVERGNPTSGTIRLILDSPLSSDSLFFTRQRGNSRPVIDPHCEELAEALVRSKSAWTAPAGCSVVAWSIQFETASEPTIDVSRQRNLYHPDGWWLFTEWEELLRPMADEANSVICAEGEHPETCRPVPPVSAAPLFFVVGEPQESIVLGGTIFRFFVGHLPATFDVDGLFETYQKQLSYLRSLMATQQSASSSQRDIDVVLLGIDAAQGTTGGAAGSNAFLANVVVGDGTVSLMERTRLLWLSGHELSHMLGLGTGTIWASESLAHYYGFKSLAVDVSVDDVLVRRAAELDERDFPASAHALRRQRSLCCQE